MKMPIALFAIAALAGCSKPPAGPQTPEVAREAMNKEVKIDEPDAAPPRPAAPPAPGEITKGDRNYWDAYCRQFGYGDNFRLDGRLVIPDLPREEVSDPLLIAIHNTTIDVIGTMGKQLEQAAQGRQSEHPAASQNAAYQRLKPKLEEATKKYGVPRVMENTPVVGQPNSPPGP